MTFVDLVTGDKVFLDANTFVYHFAPDPAFQAPCADLLQRIANQDLVGYTSTAILSETAHRLMTIEARARLGWSQGKVVQRLKQNPAIVQSLGRYRTAVENVLLRSQIQILEISPALILAAAAVSQQTGLLTNDALLVAVMQDHGISKLASQDADFDRVPGLTRYAPV